MRYMVVEHYRNGPGPVYARAAAEGRMLPDGLHYVASWVTADGGHCFQLMETTRPELFAEWIARWDDLVEFEVAEVVDSAAAAAAAGTDWAG